VTGYEDAPDFPAHVDSSLLRRENAIRGLMLAEPHRRSGRLNLACEEGSGIAGERSIRTITRLSHQMATAGRAQTTRGLLVRLSTIAGGYHGAQNGPTIRSQG